MAWTTPTTRATGDLITAAIWNADIVDNLVFLGKAARVYNSGSSQALSNNTFTAIAFNAESYDTDAIHDNASNNTRLTCKTAGKYQIYGRVVFAGSTVNQRAARIRLNNSGDLDYDERNGASSGTELTPVSVFTEYQLAVNDYVELLGWQNSGGNLDVLFSGATYCHFGMRAVAG